MSASRLILLFLLSVTVLQPLACKRIAPTSKPAEQEELTLDPERQLIKAAQRGDLESVELLLAKGVDVNAQPALGISALWQACWSGHTEVAKALLQKGADVNAYDQGFRRSPLMLAQDPELITLLVAKGATDAPAQLCQAALDGSSDKVKAILAGRSFLEDELVIAKANAELMRHDSVAELLDAAAGRQLPPPPRVEAESLKLLVGDFRDARLELVQVQLRVGALVLQVGADAPQVLLPIDESTFQRGARSYRFHTTASGSCRMETFVASRLRAIHIRDYQQESVNGIEREDRLLHQADEVTRPDEDITRFDTWPQFRGHSARGIASEQDLPAEFSTERNQNIRWNASIPGFGVSSPIVWKDRLFLTTAVRESGSDELIVGDYTEGHSTLEELTYTWKLYCLDSSTGREVWNRVASASIPTVGRHPKSSYANPTPTTDGTHVIALFNSGDLQCYTTTGELLWKKHLGVLRTGAVPEPEFEWGFASSPVIQDRLVIIQCDLIDQSYVVAYDLENGIQVWKTERDEPPAWGTPLVFRAAHGLEVVTSGSNFIRGYDLRSGQERWRLPGMSAITVPTPQYWDEHLFVASGQLPTQPIFAIRTNSDPEHAAGVELAWSHERGGPYVITPLVYRGHLYVCSTNGVLTCYEARTGQRVYRKRIARSGADSFSASPVAADDLIYFAAETGTIVVVRAGPQFSLSAVNAVDDYCLATPAIASGKLFVRTRHGLVAVGKASR